jgi:hypothetical protein
MTEHRTEHTSGKTGQRALRRLRVPTPLTGLESLDDDEPDLSRARIKTTIEAARERFRRIAERSRQDGSDLNAYQQQVLDDAKTALERLAAEGEQANLSDRQIIGLEAVIVPDGTRPALFVKDSTVNPAGSDAGTWSDRISTLLHGIERVARSVGRINAQIGFPNYAGTGFVVADSLILTNRHVLEEVAGEPVPETGGIWQFNTPVTIDFAAEFERDRRSEFKVTGVTFAGPERIGDGIELSRLDVALLQVEPHNGTEDLPPPLPLSRRIKRLSPGSEVYVMGYPARPSNEVGQVLMTVFQDEYYVKRFAPGYVDDDPAQVDDGGHKRVFTHDSSTLGGNSGSCVVEFRIDGFPVVGLHFGGTRRVHNFAHAVARIEGILSAHGAVFQD